VLVESREVAAGEQDEDDVGSEASRDYDVFPDAAPGVTSLAFRYDLNAI
jgi:hypothetical protein